jgi:hypothetical protein
MPVLSAMSLVDYFVCRTCKRVSVAPKNGVGILVPAHFSSEIGPSSRFDLG